MKGRFEAEVRRPASLDPPFSQFRREACEKAGVHTRREAPWSARGGPLRIAG
jgi:hypothetical protein